MNTTDSPVFWGKKKKKDCVLFTCLFISIIFLLSTEFDTGHRTQES